MNSTEATALRRLTKRASFRAFMWLDKAGLHVLPKHYYTPVPDYAWLAKNKHVWARRADLTGVAWDLRDQLEWLRRTCSPYYEEVKGLEHFREAARLEFGPGYGPIESQVLHCFVRSAKPARIIEVGSGVSTVCILGALERNAREEGARRTEVTCVEPFPNRALQKLPGISLTRRRAQEAGISFFEQLQSGDLLFIDSSHAVKTGSELPFLYLEVIPRLNPGVIVHIHDVFLPYLYQRNVLTHYLSSQETSLLLALLKGNARLSVLCCLSALHYDFPDEIAKTLTDYRPQAEVGEGLSEYEPSDHFPSSIWLRVN